MNTGTPGTNLAGGVDSYTDADTVLHIKSASNRAILSIEGGGKARFDMIDLGGGTDDKVLSYKVENGRGKFTAHNDNFTIRFDIMALDMGTGFVAIGDNATALGMLHVEDTEFEGSVGVFINAGDSDGNDGLSIQAGDADATTAGNATFLLLFDGDAVGGSGTLKMIAGAVALSDPSDKKLKNNIRKTKRNARNIFKVVEIKDFSWKSDDSNTTRTGLIAQDVEVYFPEAVGSAPMRLRPTTHNEVVSFTSGTLLTTKTISVDDPIEMHKTVNRLAFIVPLIQETQRQQREIELLWAALAALSLIVTGLIREVRKIAKKVDMPVASIDALDKLEDETKEL